MASTALCWFAYGCHNDGLVAPEVADWSLSVAAGNLQRVPAGSTLPQSLGVKLLGAGGVPVKGARVVFGIRRGAAGGSVLLDSIAVTGPDGVARTDLRVGGAPDTTEVVAYPTLARSRSVTLLAYATVAPSLVSALPSTFAAGDTVRLRGSGLSAFAVGVVEFGEAPAPVLPGASDSLLMVVVPACVTEGATAVRAAVGTVRSNAVSATYRALAAPVVIPTLTAVTVPSANLASCLRLAGNGATYLVAPQFAAVGSSTTAIDWRVGSTTAGTALVAGASVGHDGDNALRREFEGTLRQLERSIAPEVRAQPRPAVRPVAYAEGALNAPSVGSTRTFKVVAKLDGSRFAEVSARLRYVGDHLLLYVDTAGQGFTDDQYARLGTLFDRELYPLDIAAFGSESDLDANGRVVVLFTPVVNALSLASECGQKGFVTGFFYSNDLLLLNPNSNKGEIFYSFIPDAQAAYSCSHTADFVMRTLPGTFLHELQHMISFNQHVVARGGDSESPWLNEGLSHFAEELGSRYYEARFPYPSGRTSPDQLFPDSASIFITPQLLNAYTYLNGTRAHSVTTYDGGGSIEDRGATWLFLRWLAEQKGDAVIARLVQTSKTGVANIEEKSGEPFGILFGDFSMALYADSLLGVPRAQVSRRYQFGAVRNLRRMMLRLALVEGFLNPWPLPLFPLRLGGSLLASMPAGTMLHSLVQTRLGDPGFALGFTRPDGAAFNGSDRAQVSIFRLSP